MLIMERTFKELIRCRLLNSFKTNWGRVEVPLRLLKEVQNYVLKGQDWIFEFKI